MSMNKIKVGIAGASGYTGQELVRLLVQHPNVQLEKLTSGTYAGRRFSDIFPSFIGHTDIKFSEMSNLSDLAESCDVILCAMPHGIAAQHIDEALVGRVKIIDLSGDFRLKNPSEYDEWYHAPHLRPSMLAGAVFGLPERRRSEIAKASLLANPGCYATCSILALLPLAEANLLKEPIIVDAKSGVSGAGRSAVLDTLLTECSGSIKAYKVASHRHTPEIEQELNSCSNDKLKITFTPHLVPMNRGILVTAYCPVDSKTSLKEIVDLYQAKYDSEPFVQVLESQIPETRWTKGSNMCQIGLTVDKRTNQLIVVAAIDNLLKGASGQAVQNMNIMFGLPETTGLTQIPVLP